MLLALHFGSHFLVNPQRSLIIQVEKKNVPDIQWPDILKLAF